MRNVKSVIVLLMMLVSGGFSAQIIVPNYTACPNQTMLVAPVWNNVTNITYFLTVPSQAPVQVGPQFTISGSTGGTAVIYTLVGNGTAASGPVTSTVNFNLSVTIPTPLSFTNNVNFCFGSTGSFTTTIGGTSYSVGGGCSGNQVSSSNIITLPNLTAACAGIYSVSSVIGGCLRTGTTTVNVAPNNQISITTPTAVCNASCVSLDATMTSGVDFNWLDNGNNLITGNIAASPNGTGLLYSKCGVTPAESGVYTATANILYNGIKCPRTATTSLMVVPTSPVLASASPANVVCQGTPINLNASTTASASGYSWNGPQSFFSTQQNPSILLALPNNSGNYSVTAVFQGGSAVCTTSAVVNVGVVPVSQPQLTGPNSVCEGITSGVTYTATTTTANTGITWSGPCVPGSSFGSILTLSQLGTNCSGVYYATAKFQLATSAVTCASTSSIALNVIPVNSITVIPPAPACMPNNVSLQSNAPGATSYIWTGPNNFVNPGANITIYNPNPNYNGQYTITAFFNGGNIVCSNTNVVNVTVSPALTFTLDKHKMVCYDEPVTLVGPMGGTSYKWTSSTGLSATTKDLVLPTAQTTDAGTYTLEVGLGQCFTTDDTELEVLDHVTFSLTPASKTVCKGDTVLLEGAVQGGSHNYAYVWNPPLYMNSPIGNQKSVVPLGTVVYNLMAHDIACPFFTVATTCTINVAASSIPTLELNRDRGCSPLILHYDTRLTPGEAIITYDWGKDLVVQRDNFDYALTEPGEYKLKVYTKNVQTGCSNTLEYPYVLTVDPSPGADFYLEPERPTTADKILFHPTNKYDPITRYTWQFEGGVDLTDTSKVKNTTVIDTSEQIVPQRQYNVAGFYRTLLMMENDWGCVDTVYKVVEVIDDLNIYIPNTFTPNGDGINDVFYVKGMGMQTENYVLQIIDRWGNIVFETKDINQGWDGKVKGSPARDGTYTCFVKVVGANGEGRKEYKSHLNVLK